MATTLPIYGGPTKRTLVQMAYALCGHSDYEFELAPEEFESALRRLNAIMARMAAEGVSIGYNFPLSPAVSPGVPDDESGIPDSATDAVAGMLAKAIAAQIGKQLTPEATGEISRNVASLRAAYAVLPTSQIRGDTLRGSGQRWWPWAPYYPPSAG